MTRPAFALICLLLSPLVASAQQTLPEEPQPQYASLRVDSAEIPRVIGAAFGEQPPPEQERDKPQQQGPEQDPFKAEDKQRILGIVPTRNVVLSGHADPLSNKQKFTLWLHSAVDPFTFVSTGFTAGIEQAQNSYAGYGQGAAGYGKRFGAAYADTVDGHLWGKAILPSLLRQDPRYFRLGQGTLKHRAWYAIEGAFRCKGDSGRWQFAYSNIGGNFIGGAIANAYYPPSSRGIRLVLDRGLIVTAEGAFGLLGSEFYPDIIAHFKRKGSSSTRR